MKRKKLLIPTILVFVLFAVSLAANIGGRGGTTNTTSSTLSSTSTGGHGGTTNTTSSTQSSVASVCPTILPGPSTASNVTQYPATVGTNFTLDASALFGSTVTSGSYHWEQVYPSRTELDYVTSFNATIWNPTQRIAKVLLPYPGNYRFQLETVNGTGQATTHRVDLLATTSTYRKLDAKGVIFGDVFESLGGANFQLGPSSTQCQTASFDSAMAGPQRVGAGWVGFVPAAFYSQISPTPIIGSNNSDLSLTNDTYYYGLIASAKSHGFNVVQFEQTSVGPDTPSDQVPMLGKMENSSSWWSAWFDQWKAWDVAQAVRAQKAGVDMLVLCLYCEDTFRPSVYPNYTQRWDDIIASVRQVFTGKVAMSLIVTDDRFTMYKQLDAVFITTFPGLYTSSNSFRDPSNPTIRELENATERLVSYAAFLAGKITVYYIFLAYSSVGQYNADPPPWGNNPPPANLTDFREQAMYYEAFFNVIQNKSWISGVFSERWDYFDHFARLGDAPSSYYFDQTIGVSPRNKPAESVVKLWFGIM